MKFARSLLLPLLLTVCTVVPQSASATTMYANGLTAADNISYSSLLTNGWTSLLDVTYSTPTTNAEVASWQSTIGTGYVFVGAVDSTTGKLVLGATGLASQVLDATFSTSTAASYASSNLYWYDVSGDSFGFTPTQSIVLNEADVKGSNEFGGGTDDGNNALRLSWHTIDGFTGGWRAGAITNLNADTQYYKVVLMSPASVPDGGSTLGLLGLALGGIATVRRKLGVA